jgi:AraC-like DNA-binding protein
MPESGKFTFSDPDDFRGSLRRAGIELVLTVSGDFKGRQTCVELPHLRLLRSWEERPRVAYVSLAPDRVFITFAPQSGRPLVWGGVELQPGDVVFHGRGERMHQRTSAPCHWAFISQTPEHLAACGKALIGRDLVAPRAGQVLRLPAPTLAPLRRLHADACRLVEKKPKLVAHPEVVHALEQDLIYALVTCLVDRADRPRVAPKHYRADIMRQFEQALAATSEHPPHMPELCKAIGVPERTLRLCCTEFLGMAPTQYFRLQRLGMVRSALRRPHPATANVSDIAARYGFRQLGRFAVQYRAMFGEAPSTTLRRAPSDRNDTIRAELA